MEEYGENVYVRAGQDRSHYGKYEVELEAGVLGYIDAIKVSLESYGGLLVDFDQWGLRYFSSDDPDLTIEANELDDYGDKSILILRKEKLSKDEIDIAKDYLRQIYHEITDGINAQSVGFIYQV
jgi:hypothetical protein